MDSFKARQAENMPTCPTARRAAIGTERAAAGLLFNAGYSDED